MNENQRAFLDELGKLLDKYSIDKMCASSYDDTGIDFLSNDELLRVQYCEYGTFCGVTTHVNEYEPRREGVNDDR